MAKHINKSARVVHVGDVMMVPGIETEVPDDALNHPVAKNLVETKQIVPAEEAAPAKPVFPDKK